MRKILIWLFPELCNHKWEYYDDHCKVIQCTKCKKIEEISLW